MKARFSEQECDEYVEVKQVFLPNQALLDALERVSKQVNDLGKYERKQLEAFFKSP